MLFHLANGSVHVLVGEDWEERSEDLVLHDRIGMALNRLIPAESRQFGVNVNP